MQDGTGAQHDQPGRPSFSARVSRLARRRSVQVVTGAALLAAAAAYLAVAAPSAAQQPAADDSHADLPPAAAPTGSTKAAVKDAAPQSDGSGGTHVDASLSQRSSGQTSSTLTINGQTTTLHHSESVTKHIVSDDGNTSIDFSSTSSAGGSGTSSNETSLNVQIDGMSESEGGGN